MPVIVWYAGMKRKETTSKSVKRVSTVEVVDHKLDAALARTACGPPTLHTFVGTMSAIGGSESYSQLQPWISIVYKTTPPLKL